MLKFKRNIGNISPPQARKNNTRGCYLGGGFTLGGAVLQTPLWVGLRLGGSCFIFGARGRKNCPKIDTQKIWPSPQLKKYLLSLRFPAFAGNLSSPITVPQEVGGSTAHFCNQQKNLNRTGTICPPRAREELPGPAVPPRGGLHRAAVR